MGKILKLDTIIQLLVKNRYSWVKGSTGFSQESLTNTDTFVEEIEPRPDDDPGRTSNTAASLTLPNMRYYDTDRTNNTTASLALPTMRYYGLQDSSLQDPSHLLPPAGAGTHRDPLSDGILVT